ncbi:MAG: addiction module protein [Kiritimatiellae bacterium]|nr:addiction module protein [Kiritimatiellia bacterium]
MAFTLEQINDMTAEERVQSMEFLWKVMSSAGNVSAPHWHAEVLAERRRRVESGEDELISIDESKRRLKEAVAYAR